MNKRLMILISMIALMFSGCNKIDESEYYRMLNAKNELEYTVDINKYKDGILFLASSDSRHKNILLTNKDKYSDIINSVLYERLINESIDIENVNNNIENMDNIDDTQELDNTNIDNSYPIYDEHGSIISYGTKEESERSYKAFQALPENTILSYSIADHRIYVRINNKSTGEYLMILKLDIDNKISHYEIYR